MFNFLYTRLLLWDVILIEFFSLRKRATPKSSKKIMEREANEDAKVSEFQKELILLAVILKGEDILMSRLAKFGKIEYDPMKRFLYLILFPKGIVGNNSVLKIVGDRLNGL
ncbi:hypothetical protein ACP275_04G066900 [Erythranthe tilingii]